MKESEINIKLQEMSYINNEQSSIRITYRWCSTSVLLSYARIHHLARV